MDLPLIWDVVVEEWLRRGIKFCYMKEISFYLLLKFWRKIIYLQNCYVSQVILDKKDIITKFILIPLFCAL